MGDELTSYIRSILGIPVTIPRLTDSVLVIIDAQNEYISGLLQVEDSETSRKVIYGLLEKYRNVGSDIVHVVADSPPGAPIFTPNTPLADILDELKPLDNEPVVHKLHASAFTETTLQSILTNLGKKNLVLTGYMAHNCVSATARAGAELGYNIYVVRDAVGDRHLPGVDADQLVKVSLTELADVVAVIIDSKDLES
ncbi:Isochorismatase-like protein [Talaromyces proteolyticus]|uniref:Isochorismatase-like protein n=1 Tax=Talaromyces proteolyticus TaxID=1131652 RepID=A0AAD4PWS7_9EURO|nr:Isochorismatase-like protein [Talaromyces proteolyticus]KAH8698487.1 Isochorismatase-like protein [Talaromyces proteolyticus]